MSHDEIMNDLQPPKKEDRELEKVVQRIRLLYVEAKHMPQIHNPIAWRCTRHGRRRTDERKGAA